jgi:hypothetical protein
MKVACNDQDETLLFLSPDDSNSMSSPAQVRDRVLSNDSQTSTSTTSPSGPGSS